MMTTAELTNLLSKLAQYHDQMEATKATEVHRQIVRAFVGNEIEIRELRQSLNECVDVLLDAELSSAGAKAAAKAREVLQRERG